MAIQFWDGAILFGGDGGNQIAMDEDCCCGGIGMCSSCQICLFGTAFYQATLVMEGWDEIPPEWYQDECAESGCSDPCTTVPPESNPCVNPASDLNDTFELSPSGALPHCATFDIIAGNYCLPGGSLQIAVDGDVTLEGFGDWVITLTHTRHATAFCGGTLTDSFRWRIPNPAKDYALIAVLQAAYDAQEIVVLDLADEINDFYDTHYPPDPTPEEEEYITDLETEYYAEVVTLGTMYTELQIEKTRKKDCSETSVFSEAELETCQIGFCYPGIGIGNFEFPPYYDPTGVIGTLTFTPLTIPEVLYLTLTSDCEAFNGIEQTLTYDPDVGKWVGEGFDCGEQHFDVTLECAVYPGYGGQMLLQILTDFGEFEFGISAGDPTSPYSAWDTFSLLPVYLFKNLEGGASFLCECGDEDIEIEVTA